MVKGERYAKKISRNELSYYSALIILSCHLWLTFG